MDTQRKKTTVLIYNEPHASFRFCQKKLRKPPAGSRPQWCQLSLTKSFSLLICSACLPLWLQMTSMSYSHVIYRDWVQTVIMLGTTRNHQLKHHQFQKLPTSVAAFDWVFFSLLGRMEWYHLKLEMFPLYRIEAELVALVIVGCPITELRVSTCWAADLVPAVHLPTSKVKS